MQAFYAPIFTRPCCLCSDPHIDEYFLQSVFGKIPIFPLDFQTHIVCMRDLLGICFVRSKGQKGCEGERTFASCTKRPKAAFCGLHYYCDHCVENDQQKGRTYTLENPPHRVRKLFCFLAQRNSCLVAYPLYSY
jgi:hypothetical protein